MHALLFDLGGTFLRAGTVTDSGKIEYTTKARIGSITDGLDAPLIWERVTASILAYEAKYRRLVSDDAPVVISFPGPIAGGVTVLQAPTLCGQAGPFDLAGAIKQGTGRQTVLLNDVSAAAWHLAEVTTARSFMVTTVSSGIGSKIFYRAHPSGVLDEPPYAGEIGHIVVNDSVDAPVCDCGARGHLGAIASGRGIERRARQKAMRKEADFQKSLAASGLGATPETLNNEDHIVPAVLAGDAWATSLVVECTRPLVLTLLTVAIAAGLERIFLIGGFANALGFRYIEILRQLAAAASQYEPVREKLDGLFEAAPCKGETCLQGCAAFLRHRRRLPWFHDVGESVESLPSLAR
ncbi:MAG: ROK family protein [Acidobacteriaceae bacterium]|nr:ROK family protein [Acidobacteriaceae bacterium]